jgi:hypothetical protein
MSAMDVVSLIIFIPYLVVYWLNRKEPHDGQDRL